MIEYLTSSVFIVVMIKIVIIFGGVMGALAYLTWVERKIMARVQMRPGPTRVGPFGLLQPLADGMKFLFKEDVIPTNANTFLFLAAPVLSLVPAMLSFAVIPFGPWLQVSDPSVGLLFIFAITSPALRHRVGRWASNSKYR
jgi:NADH-quinone oxidoreductase subunit H